MYDSFMKKGVICAWGDHFKDTLTTGKKAPDKSCVADHPISNTTFKAPSAKTTTPKVVSSLPPKKKMF